MTKYKTNGTVTLEVGAVDLTAYLTELDDFGKTIQEVPGTTFSDVAERVLAGIEASQTLGATFFFDDTATTGPDAVLSADIGTVETIKVTAEDGTRSFSASMLMTEYRCQFPMAGYVMIRVVWRQDGAVTVGTT